MKNFREFIALFISAIFMSLSLSAQEYTFKKVREIRVESLAKVGIRDYDPKRDIYAGYIDKGSMGVELAIFDSGGKILTSKKRQGEGPEDYVISALAMGFSSDGNLWVQTSMELLKYDLEFNLIQRKKFEPKGIMHIYTGPRAKFIPLTKANEPSFVLNISNSFHLTTNEIIPSKIYLLNYFDADHGIINSVIPLSSRNGFKGIEFEKFKGYVNPIFTTDSKKNELYFTTSLDNEITVYNPINWHVIKRIPIQHESFQPLDDIPIRESNLPSVPSMGRPGLFEMNRDLLVFESDLIGVVYVKGESEAQYESRKSKGEPGRLDDPEFQRIILFKNGVQLPGELTIPSGLIQMTLPNNRVLVKVVNEEEELDYYPFEIWELVKK